MAASTSGDVGFANNGGSRSPTNNIGAHMEQIVGNEVDLASSEYGYGSKIGAASRLKGGAPGDLTTDQAARAKRVIFEAV